MAGAPHAQRSPRLGIREFVGAGVTGQRRTTAAGGPREQGYPGEDNLGRRRRVGRDRRSGGEQGRGCSGRMEGCSL
jgi:hypothetical protein